MGSFKEIDLLFDRLENDFLKKQASSVLAETATEVFKDTFAAKEWDGQPWPPTKAPVTRGSLLLRSGKLMNSIRPSVVESNRVVISAGNDQVPYARVHNEGGVINVPVTEKMKRFAWAMHYKQEKKKPAGNTPWKGLALTKKETLTIQIPMRRFMGFSKRLSETVVSRLKDAFSRTINP